MSDPRIAPLRAHEWSDEARDQLRGHVARIDRYLSGEPDAPPMPPVLGVLGRHPRLGSAWLQFNGTLLGSTVLEARRKELLILRVAWLAGSQYEWQQHVRIGREAGLTPDQIEAVALGPEAPIWSPPERALLLAADELLGTNTVADTTWEVLATFFDDRQLLEVLFVVGAYLGLALVFNGVGIEAPPDPGRSSRATTEEPGGLS